MLTFPGNARNEIIVLDYEALYYYIEPELLELNQAKGLAVLDQWNQ